MFGIRVVCRYRWKEFDLTTTTSELYTCEGENIFCDKDNNNTVIWGVIDDVDYHKIEAFTLNNASLLKVPLGVEEYFQNIKAIELEHNSITTIVNNDILRYRKLEYLSLSNNLIVNLDADLFDGLPNLAMIRFRSNHITHVGHDIKLPSELVDLQDNPCISENAGPHSVDTLRFTLLRECPPTISQIEWELEHRNNLLTFLRDENTDKEKRVSLLELINQRMREALMIQQL